MDDAINISDLPRNEAGTVPALKVYGNEILQTQIARWTADGRLSHAYLLYGEKFLGKRTIAKRFAMAILCQGEPRPCGTCKSCKKILSGIHPDVYIYEGREGKNAIHIDAVRQIRAQAYIRPNESVYKVYILPNAEDLSLSAANAFLHLLEEPPPHAIFILTAQSKEAVVPTVLSRCIPFQIFPLPVHETAEILASRFPEATPLELEEASAFAAGNLGLSIRYMTDEEFRNRILLSKDALAAIARKDEYAFLLIAGSVNNSRESMLDFLFGMTWALQAAVTYKMGIAGEGFLPPCAKELAEVSSLACLQELYLSIASLREGILGNVNLTMAASRLTAAVFALG